MVIGRETSGRVRAGPSSRADAPLFSHRGWLGLLGALLVARVLVAQSDLGSGQVRIVGTGLDVTPPSQTVPIGVATRVDTRLQAPPGSLPPTIAVRAELTGPGVPGSLQLSAEPNG